MAGEIYLEYSDAMPPELVAILTETIGESGLRPHGRSRPANAMFAGMEWLIPTTVVLYFSKSYFDAFLKEAGKDHYNLLKRAVVSLYKKVRPIKVTLIGTPGKVSAVQLYSRNFSVVVEGPSGFLFKLLIANTEDIDEITLALNTFLDFLREYHEGRLQASALVRVSQAKAFGQTYLVRFNSETGQLEFLTSLRSAPPEGLDPRKDE